jgi:hypothetical protein
MDSTTLIRTEPAFRLRFDADSSCVEMAWRGYHTSASFKDNNERVLALLAERRATRLLCDIRRFILIHGSEQEWLSSDWLPRAMGLGLSTCAIVTPLYYFNRVAVETVAGRIDRKTLLIEYFDSRRTARKWLRAQP